MASAYVTRCSSNDAFIENAPKRDVGKTRDGRTFVTVKMGTILDIY